MVGLYGRMVDPNFAAPTRGGNGSNAGIGAPGGAGLPRQQEDDFNAQQMAGLLGLMARKKPEEEGKAAPGAAAPGAAQPGMAPIGNEGNFDMAPAMAGQLDAPDSFGNAQGGFAMPPAGSGEAFQLGNVGGNGPLMSNFGGGIPAAAPHAAGAMPASIGGAGIPSLEGMDPSMLQNLQLPWMQGGFGG